MRITAVIDDELVEKARKLTNINSNSELVRKAVKTLGREGSRLATRQTGRQPTPSSTCHAPLLRR